MIPAAELIDADLIGLYRTMLTMRHFEEALMVQSTAGNLRGSLHLARGQEAIPAGVCLALRQSDSITMTYRGHGYVLAKGCDLGRVVAEICGRADGICGGKGGKMHIFDPEHGVLGANGIVAGGIPTAAGAALSAKLLKEDRIAVTVFGDGAINQGVVHEVMNMAGLWKLPLIFLCENNHYSEMTPLDRSSAVTKLADRTAAYAIESVIVDGNDVLAVYEATAMAADKARAGGGATFIEAMTYRTCGHYNLDPGLSYRTKEEVAEWETKSPIIRFAAWLTENSKATTQQLLDIEAESKGIVDDAVEFALASPFPDEATALQGVFV